MISGLLEKADKYYVQGRIEESIEFYEKALGLDPYNAEAWVNKGFALFDLTRHKEAIECYDKAIQIDPDNAGAWYNRGLALYNLGKNKEAIDCLNKAIECEPNNPDYRETREKLSTKWWKLS